MLVKQLDWQVDIPPFASSRNQVRCMSRVRVRCMSRIKVKVTVRVRVRVRVRVTVRVRVRVSCPGGSGLVHLEHVPFDFSSQPLGSG